MIILFTLRFFPVYGGGETVTLRLADKFVSMGHEVHIFYLWDNGKQEYPTELKLFKVSEVKPPVNKEEICSDDNKLIYKSLNMYIQKNRIKYVINQWLNPKKVYQASSGMAKVFHCRHAAVYINSVKWNCFRRMLGKVLFDYILAFKYRNYIEYGDRFVLLCDEYATEMKKIFLHKRDDKIISMLNPCRFDIPSDMVFGNKENAICYVGRIYPEKQLDILIKAWKDIEDIVVKDSWFFYIIGTGDDISHVQSLAKSLECKNIRFEGFQIPIEYYKKCKIFVSASATEGYPMTIIEAMAYGVVPIIANTYSALEGIIPCDYNGIKVNNVEVLEFAKELRNLMNDNDILQKKSNIAHLFCKENYSVKNIAMEWINLFREFE